MIFYSTNITFMLRAHNLDILGFFSFKIQQTVAPKNLTNEKKKTAPKCPH